MDKCKCYLCERTCYCESKPYEACLYRKQKSFGCMENRAYEDACNRLALRFARKHEWRFEGWVGHFDPHTDHWYEGCGGMAHMGDYVVPMEDIRTDLMMDADPDAYIRYLDDYTAEQDRAMLRMETPRHVNYRNWLRGARHNPAMNTDAYNALRRKEIAEARERLAVAKASIEQEIERMAHPYNPEQLQRDADDLFDNSEGLF